MGAVAWEAEFNVKIVDVLLANLDDAYERKAWHGPNLRGALRGLTTAELVWRPDGGRNSIWELAMHAAYWKYAVRRRLTGEKRGSFPLKGSNFFSQPDSPSRDEMVSVLDTAHRELRATVQSLGAKALADPKTVRMISGVAAHDLYHTGQIQLLKRLQRGTLSASK